MRCYCCGSNFPTHDMIRVGSNREYMHWLCWEEHHSDPTGVWPPDHNCMVDTDRRIA